MSFGFPAYFTESRTLPRLYGELPSIVASALNNLGWYYEAVSENSFRARVNAGLASFGENVLITILPGGVVMVNSKCDFPFQCLDWGKNKQNVKAFFSQLENI